MLIKTLKRACFGFILGMAVGSLLSALLGGADMVAPALLERLGSRQAALVAQTLLSGVIGIAGFAGVSLYEIERWPLLLTVLVHYLIYMVVFIPAGLFLKWISTGADILVMALILAAMQFVIFIIMCAVYRAQVQELNKLQMKLSKHGNDENNGGAK